MRLRFLAPCLFMAVSLAAGLAGAAEPAAIRLVAQPPLGADLSAFPRIAATEDPALQRINRLWQMPTPRVVAAAKDCRSEAVQEPDGPRDGEWQRTVTVAMSGPGYLTLVASDNCYCGGAHPDGGSFALAYDLRTGSPLNWERLLPKTLAGTASLD